MKELDKLDIYYLYELITNVELKEECQVCKNTLATLKKIIQDEIKRQKKWG